MAASMGNVSAARAGQNCAIHDLYDHPKYHYMLSFGFCDEEQLRLSLLVYLDLTESKSWWNVQITKCDGLQKVIISGHPSRKDPITFVLAMSKETQISIAMFNEILRKMQEEKGVDRVTVALVGGDSDTVYYTIADGLMKPEPPEALEAKKSERQRKMRRRYTRFIRLAQMPHNRPQFALHSSRANQQEESTSQSDGRLQVRNEDAGSVEMNTAIVKSQTDTETTTKSSTPMDDSQVDIQGRQESCTVVDSSKTDVKDGAEAGMSSDCSRTNTQKSSESATVLRDISRTEIAVPGTSQSSDSSSTSHQFTSKEVDIS